MVEAPKLMNQPLVLPCGARLQNRLCKAAATEGLADDLSRATEKHVRLYTAWAESKVGLMITGNVQVDRRYVERPGNVGIDGPQDEASMKALRAYSTAAKSQGALAFVQLSHAGRQSALVVSAIAQAPSSVSCQSPIPLPTAREMTEEEINQLPTRFAHAAKVCQDAGFDGVQIHSAHGYLMSSFLSPLANQRTDCYGGTLKNRASILLKTVAAARKAVGPAFAISVKLNSSDFQKNGYSHQDALLVAEWLDQASVDLIELSGGNYESPAMAGKGQTCSREAYFMEYAADIVKVLKRAKLMVTGGFRSRAGIEQALASTHTDLIGIVRPLCVDPRCTRGLLDGTVDQLPAPEKTLPVPGLLQWLATLHPSFALAGIGSNMLVFYDNLIHWGSRMKSSDIQPRSDVSILAAVFRVQGNDVRQANSLKKLAPLPKQDREALAERSLRNKVRVAGFFALLVLLMKFVRYMRRPALKN